MKRARRSSNDRAGEAGTSTEQWASALCQLALAAYLNQAYNVLRQGL